MRLVTACSEIISSPEINFNITPQTKHLSLLGIGGVAHGQYIINHQEKIKLKEWLIYNEFNWFASFYHRNQSRDERILMSIALLSSGKLITTKMIDNYQESKKEEISDGSMSSSDLIRHLSG